jgi:1-acyl-sn-glycerol-3-phosphate acyltransferase
VPAASPVPPAIPRRGGALARALGRLLLVLLGWRVEGTLPDRRKIVAIVAPHSSNLDFLIAIALVFSWNLRVRYLGKKELFRFPLGGVMRWLGGIPIDRQNPRGVIDQVVGEVDRVDQILLGIAPEGTRTHGARWKSGFYWIASRSGAVIVPVYLDWSRRVIGIAAPHQPTGDSRADLAAIVRSFGGYPRKDGRLIDVDRALGEGGGT